MSSKVMFWETNSGNDKDASLWKYVLGIRMHFIMHFVCVRVCEHERMESYRLQPVRNQLSSYSKVVYT
jgi:hypothetical protein